MLGTSRNVLKTLPTPCLVADLAAVDRNITRMASYLSERPGILLRPHFKAHKCTTLMRRQLEAGNCSGVTAATAQEALVLARAGFADVLVANEVVDPRNLGLLADAGERAQVSTVADHPSQVAALQLMAAARDVRFGVLVDVDPGMHRTGLAPEDPLLLEVVRSIDAAPNLTFLGIFAYEGHAQHAAIDERRVLVQEAAQITAKARRSLERAGFSVALVSGGGSGTFDLVSEAGVLNEIQAGSYVLMDREYEDAGGLPWEAALYCLTRVISRPSPTTAVVNGGLKAMSFEKGPPRGVSPSIRPQRLSDEHAVLEIDPGLNLQIGDPVLLVPSHLDPTVNLHDVLFAWDGSGIHEWPIDGRRSNAHQ